MFIRSEPCVNVGWGWGLPEANGKCVWGGPVVRAVLDLEWVLCCVVTRTHKAWRLSTLFGSNHLSEILISLFHFNMPSTCWFTDRLLFGFGP